MAITTYKIFLMKKGTGDTYEKLVDIKDYPDLGGAPEMIESTTMSHKMQTFEMGVQTLNALEFTANYSPEDFLALSALEGISQEFAVWFGGTETGDILTPTGEDGKFSFTGKLSVFAPGGGINEIVDMKITIAPSTVIVFSAS